jgi:hypothetical protein
MAKQRGCSTYGYWWAFVVCLIAPPILLILAVVGLGVTHHTGSPVPAPAGVSQPATSSPAASGFPAEPNGVAPQVGALPKESQNDDPTAVVGYMDGPTGIRAMAFQDKQPKYLLHYYLTHGTNTDSVGYAQDLQAIESGNPPAIKSVSNVQLPDGNNHDGWIVASFDLTTSASPTPLHETVTYLWNTSTVPAEWQVTKVAS